MSTSRPGSSRRCAARSTSRSASCDSECEILCTLCEWGRLRPARDWQADARWQHLAGSLLSVHAYIAAG